MNHRGTENTEKKGLEIRDWDQRFSLCLVG